MLNKFQYDWRYNHRKAFWELQILFFCIIMSICWVIFFSKSFNGLIDGVYHLQEAHEVLNDILHLQWPAIVHYDGIRGVAVPTAYPWLAFIPLSIGQFFKVPTKIQLFIYILFVLETVFNITFYAADMYWHDCKKALLFTLMADVTVSRLFTIFGNADFGFVLGMGLMSSSMFGLLICLKNGHWQMLAVSMTALTYTHFLSAYMTFLILCILLLSYSSRLSSKKIISLIKATVTTVAATVLVWGPLLILSMSNKLYTPVGHTFIEDNMMTHINVGVISAFDYLLLLIALIHIRKLAIPMRLLTIITVVIAFCQANTVPMKWLQYTPFVPMQYISRLIVIVDTLTALITVEYISRTKFNWSGLWHQVMNTTLFSVVLLSICIINLFSIMGLQNNSKPATPLQKLTSFRAIDSGSSFKQPFYLDEFIPKATLLHYAHQVSRWRSLPQCSRLYSYVPNLQMRNDMYRHHMKCINNGISINAKHTLHNVRLPIMYYHGQRYRYYLDGHRFTPSAYHQQEPFIKTVTRGHHKITFRTPVMWYRYVSALVSVLIISVWIGADRYERRKRYENDRSRRPLLQRTGDD